MIAAGIHGASGYMGGEALRVLLEHPAVDVAWATSRSGLPAEHFHRNLVGAGVRLITPEDATPCDVVFSVLDSIGKGGAHAGVQNLNLMFGLDETSGLTRHGMHPY